MDGSQQAVPPDTRALAELLAERMEAGMGRWRLELEYENGRLRRCYRHEGPLGADALIRFDFSRVSTT